MNDNKKQAEIFFEELLLEFMIENYGERCPDYEERCPVCQAWEIYDTLIGKLKPSKDVYEYKMRTLRPDDIKEIENLSAKGWNVCAATYLPGIVSTLKTIFYFRRKL